MHTQKKQTKSFLTFINAAGNLKATFSKKVGETKYIIIFCFHDGSEDQPLTPTGKVFILHIRQLCEQCPVNNCCEIFVFFLKL